MTAFHWAIVPLNVMFVRDVQSVKAYLPMAVTLSGIVMLVREEHLLKVRAEIVVKLVHSLRFMVVREVQSVKAYSSMVVTLSGIDMLDREEQPSKT